MQQLIKGELDWHDKINSNFSEINSRKPNIEISADIPAIENRQKNTLYLKITGTSSVSNSSNDIKVSPNIGIKII